jgi:hypothetical protein
MKIDKDGCIQWVNVTQSPLPEDVEGDLLATYLIFLIGKVKQDHAAHQYNVDIHNYSQFITEFIYKAKEHGYESVKYKDVIITEDKSEEEYDDIVDG